MVYGKISALSAGDVTLAVSSTTVLVPVLPASFEHTVCLYLKHLL